MNINRRILTACDYLGTNHLFHYLHRQDLLVLLYHGVVEKCNAEQHLFYRNTVSIQEFRDQLAFLRRHFRPVSPEEVRISLAGGFRLRKHAVLITFDDGFKNNLVAAYILKQFEIPAVFHVTTGYIGGKRLLWPTEIVSRVLRWPQHRIELPCDGIAFVAPNPTQRQQLARRISESCKSLRNEEREEYLAYLRSASTTCLNEYDDELHSFLSWEEVRTLSRQGFVIGSHTVEHPILSRVDRGLLDRELRDSKAAIENQTQSECYCLAYPNGALGDHTAEVIERAAAAGYEMAFMVDESFHSVQHNAFEIRRISVPGHTGEEVFRSTVSGLRSSLNAWRTSRRATSHEITLRIGKKKPGTIDVDHVGTPGGGFHRQHK